MRVNLVNLAMPSANRSVGFTSNNLATETTRKERHSSLWNIGYSEAYDIPFITAGERKLAGLDKLPAGINTQRWEGFWRVFLAPEQRPLPVIIARVLNETANNEILTFGQPQSSFERFLKLKKGVVSGWDVTTQEALNLLSVTLQDFYGAAKPNRIKQCLENLAERAKSF